MTQPFLEIYCLRPGNLKFNIILLLQVCQKELLGLDDLLKHGPEHALQGNLMCAFCGQTSTSTVSLRLHQMLWRAPHPPDHLQHSCPLHCGQSFAPKELPSHLVSYHGAKAGTEEQVALRGSLGEDGEQCPACNGEVRALEEHRVLHCARRSAVVKERISSLTSLAEEEGLAPMIVVGQEVEATLIHLRRLASPVYSQEWERAGKEACARYPGLPSSLQSELAWAPEGLEGADGIMKVFPLWEKVVERLEGAGGLGDALERVRRELGRSEWESLEQDSVLVTDKPPTSVLERLEAELGWGCTDEVPPGVEVILRGLQTQLASVQ